MAQAATPAQTFQDATKILKDEKPRITPYPDIDNPHLPVETWLTINQGRLRLHEISNEMAGAQYIALHGLTGSALEWMTVYLASANATVDAQHPLFNYANLQSTLEHFVGEDVNKADVALNSLDKLKQRGTIQQYNQQFDIITQRIPADI